MQDLEVTLQRLRKQFIRGSGERLIRIATDLDHLQADRTNSEALRELRTEFHGFSGLGGTYGFPRVTAFGRAGEQQCDAFLSSGTALADADLAAWRTLFEELRDEIGGSVTSEAGPRVLAVGDDPDQGAYLQSILEMAGYEVRIATNPAAFEAYALVFRPDVVLMDCHVAGVSGHELARVLRQGSRHAMVPVLFLTTNQQLENHVEGAIVGQEDHLVRPVAPGLLLSTVAAHIAPRE
jgi:CheY-like chemotaxis protein